MVANWTARSQLFLLNSNAQWRVFDESVEEEVWSIGQSPSIAVQDEGACARTVAASVRLIASSHGPPIQTKSSRLSDAGTKSTKRCCRTGALWPTWAYARSSNQDEETAAGGVTSPTPWYIRLPGQDYATTFGVFWAARPSQPARGRLGLEGVRRERRAGALRWVASLYR